MRTCKEFKVVGCVFACSVHAQDSLEHYCRCSKLQAAFLAISVKPTGCLDDFFGTYRGMDPKSKVECARRVRVTCRAVQLARSGEYDSLEELVAMEWQRTR